MLDLKFVREHADEVEEALQKRGLEVSLKEFSAKEQERRATLARLDELRYRRNTLSEEVGKKKKAGLHAEAQPLIDQVKEINQHIKVLEAMADEFDPWVRDFLMNLPYACILRSGLTDLQPRRTRIPLPLSSMQVTWMTPGIITGKR